MDSSTNSTWLVSSLNQAGTSTLVAIVVNDADFELLNDMVGPHFGSKQFREDYKMNGFTWFYNAVSGRRTLLVSTKANSEAKEMRGAAAKAAKQL